MARIAGCRWVYAGLDLGQRRDHSALVVVEWVAEVGEMDRVFWAPKARIRRRVRHIERFPLGTPYDQLVWQVGTTLERWPVAPVHKLALDATGVGAPVLDGFKRMRPPYKVVPVTITGGYGASERGGHWTVPKEDLISGMQLLLERGELEIAAGCEGAAELAKEMGDMRGKATHTGSQTWGAWKEGEHDDLVMATALACWAIRNDLKMVDEDEWFMVQGTLISKQEAMSGPLMWW